MTASGLGITITMSAGEELSSIITMVAIKYERNVFLDKILVDSPLQVGGEVSVRV